MAALLVAMALMSLFMSAALPAWRTLIQREREEELLWRGRQYDRALQLYKRKAAVPGPPRLDLLVEQRFLRKAYKDPITNDDFELVGVSPVGNQQARPGLPTTGGATAQPGRPGSTQGRAASETPAYRPGQLIGGVRSKSTATSILVVDGKTKHNEWPFTYKPFTLGGKPKPGSGRGVPRAPSGTSGGRSRSGGIAR